LVTNERAPHPGGGFNPPEPTTKGGPDYGRFVDAVRTLQNHARAVDAPDEVITEAADLLAKVSDLLTPFDADEWHSPSGRRMDLPVRGNILTVPMSARKTENGRVRGWARFERFHLGRNGAVHGGSLGMLFDTVLGLTSSVLTDGPYQRTAYLTINYRRIVPIEKKLQIDSGIDRVEGRKIFVSGTLSDGDTVLTEADALFVRLKPGQPCRAPSERASGAPRYKPRTAAPARRVRGLCVAVAAPQALNP
jgi:acyl-coenzyme A thioesterase PaaI-like protein